MSNTEKSSRGRPKKPDEEKSVRITVTLRPDQIEWLRARPSGISGTIADLIEIAKNFGDTTR